MERSRKRTVCVASLSGPVDPSFRALSGRLKFTVRLHKFNKGSLSSVGRVLLIEPGVEQVLVWSFSLETTHEPTALLCLDFFAIALLVRTPLHICSAGPSIKRENLC